MNNNNNQRRLFKLIVETKPSDVVTKSANSLGYPILISGVFLEAEKRNNNGRKYALDDLTRAVNEFQPLIADGRALSELEHPESDKINPDRACARITKIEQRKNQFLGEAVVLAADPTKGILGTPCGTLLAALLQYGTKVGFSSRGLGELDDDDTVHGYHLVTVDTVLNPSIGYVTNSNATRFVDGVLESTDYVVNNHSSTQVIYEAFNKNIKRLPVDNKAKYQKLTTALDTFLTTIKAV